MHCPQVNVMQACRGAYGIMSVSCDCEGVSSEPAVTPDAGIVASLDILAAEALKDIEPVRKPELCNVFRGRKKRSNGLLP